LEREAGYKAAATKRYSNVFPAHRDHLCSLPPLAADGEWESLPVARLHLLGNVSCLVGPRRSLVGRASPTCSRQIRHDLRNPSLDWSTRDWLTSLAKSRQFLPNSKRVLRLIESSTETGLQNNKSGAVGPADHEWDFSFRKNGGCRRKNSNTRRRANFLRTISWAGKHNHAGQSRWHPACSAARAVTSPATLV
jgi:hypothetical protein